MAIPRAGTPAPVDRDETLETSRLLVEFLHASYATRRLAEGDGAVGSPEVGPPAVRTHAVGAVASTGPRMIAPAAAGAGSGPSAHVIRAAIHVYQHGDRTVSQLAAGLGISLGWASRVADELVERGHAVRERDPNDRRVVRVRMTEAALAEIERAYRWRGDIVERALAEHSPEARGAIRAFLRRVVDELTIEASRRGAGGVGPAAAPAAGMAGGPGSSATIGHGPGTGHPVHGPAAATTTGDGPDDGGARTGRQ